MGSLARSTVARAVGGMRFASSLPSKHTLLVKPAEVKARRAPKQQFLVHHSKAGVMESSTVYIVQHAIPESAERTQATTKEELVNGSATEARREPSGGRCVISESMQLPSETPILLASLRQRIVEELRAAKKRGG